MARPRKVGLDYFSHDVDASGDDKIQAMEMKFGPAGYALYFKTLERIYKSVAPISYPGVFRGIMADRLRITEEALDSMIDYAINIDLLRRNQDGSITSGGAEKRREFVEKERETDRNRKSGNSPEFSAGFRPKGKEIKGKEIKGNKDEPLSLDLDDSALSQEFESARKAYPGTKRGHDPEWTNFLKKHGREKRRIIPLLLPAIHRELAHKTGLKAAGAFCPEWKNFQTWINGEFWTTEYNSVSAAISQEKNNVPYDPMNP